MNSKQKMVISVGLLFFLLVGVFPPSGAGVNRGHHFLFTLRFTNINVDQLLIEWVIVLVLTVGLSVLLHTPSK
ncbi:MAG: hypothetical protein IIB03_06845 [Acidobacteria bacterium]|nr:hypothetical protein [Acidobacteriota bacterium]